MKRRMIVMVMCLAMAGTILTGCKDKASEKPDAAEPTAEVTQAPASADADSPADTVSAELQKYIDKGSITVGTSNDAPISYINTETGKWSGFDAVIVTEACKRLGISEVKVETMAWADLIVALNSGKIDMICDCMMIKPERVEQCYFSDYLYQNSELLIVPESSTIDSKDDLTGKEVVGCTNGTTFLQTAQNWQKDGIIAEARPMGDQTELLLNVQTEKIDACLTDAFVIEYMIAQNDSEVTGLKACKSYTPEGAAGAGYACRFSDKPMMLEFNQVFADLRTEGFIDDTLESFGLSKELHGISQEEAEHNLNTK